MEIKYKKPKIDNRIVKDSGDVDLRKKIKDKPRKKLTDGNKINIVKLNFQPDRGDTVRKSKAGEKNIQEKRKDQTRRPKQNLNIHQNFEELKNTELEKRRLLQEKYTFRLKDMDGLPNHSEKGETRTQNTEYSDYTNFVEQLSKKQCYNSAAATFNDSCVPESMKTDKEPERRDNIRKPIIKTITSNYDKAKVYKAVTFIDQEQNPQKSLQINLTHNVKKTSRIPRLVEVQLVDARTDNHSIEPVKSRKKKVKRLTRNSSPELSINRNSARSTEVARWAPASVNPHTQPYYEAWVSTTLAAISRNAEKDKMLLLKENLIQSFRRDIDERTKSPQLTYVGLADERYAGRIKVHQRNSNSTTGNNAVNSDSFRANYFV